MTLTHRVVTRTAGVGFTVALVWSAITFAQNPQTSSPGDSDWIIEDIEVGYRAALDSGKPLLVAFR